jgi:hypothetical protein
MMSRRREFRNDKQGIAFLRIWQEKGRQDAAALIERMGRIPLGDRKEGMRKGWAEQAYTDGYNAELRRQRIQAKGITIGVFAE